MKYVRTLLLVSISLLLLTTCKEPQIDNSFPRSTPEAEGVSSEALLKFVNAIDREANEIHSFMLVRHGKVIAEGWWDPYRPDLKHTLYSLSKSFTSTAVGFAVSEKLLTVNDKVISFFPGEVPDTISTNLAQMTVKDLLIMSAGQAPDPTLKISGSSRSWVNSFFRTPVLNEPGTKFLYNSMATFMLSAIVQKVTGEKIIDYLKPRLFEPLGIEGADWEISPQDINTGGWGLRLKTEDIAKTGQFYLQKGNWKGEQILPAEWIEEATTLKIDQNPEAPQSRKDSSDWLQGYCYQFWRCRNNGYRGDGAYGQFMIVLPDQDAVISITSETHDMQNEINLVWEYLLPAFSYDKLPENERSLTELRQKLSSLSLPVYRKMETSTLVKEISGKTFVMESNDKQLQGISVSFADTSCTLTMRKNSQDYTLLFARGKWYFGTTNLPGPRLIPGYKMENLLPFRYAGSYTWLDNNSVELTARYIESPHTEIITCVFLGNKVGVSFKNIFTGDGTVRLIEGITAEKHKN